MLHRPSPEGTIVIAQPAPGCGPDRPRLGRPFEPWEEVCLGAEQHDIAWIGWERSPGGTPETGSRTPSRRCPRLRRLELWSGAAALLLPQSMPRCSSRCTALLVERFPPEGDENLHRALADYLDRERAFQARILESLRGDPRYAAHADPGAVERNRELIFAWDGLSLATLHGVTTERKAAGHTLAPADGDQIG